MCQHETKQCGRCHTPFECKVGNILECQCYGVSLTEEQKDYIDNNYNDCLCRSCLDALTRLPAFSADTSSKGSR